MDDLETVGRIARGDKDRAVGRLRSTRLGFAFDQFHDGDAGELADHVACFVECELRVAGSN